ncbi:MAG TPA: energy transducer TonB [Bryobacteraceae bacterium]
MLERLAWNRLLAGACIALIAGLLGAEEQQTGAGQEQVYDLGPGITPPRVTKQVNPTYRTAKGVRVKGTVIVGLVVSSLGLPRDVHVIKGIDKDVDQSAVEAVEQWRFAPARKSDTPVAVRVSLEIEFRSM